MSDEIKNCPQCESENTYFDGNLWICPECFHEWNPDEMGGAADSSSSQDVPNYLDSNGVKLESGDTVATIKDLKVGKDTIKSGTKVKNIRLLDEPVDGHDISCKVPGYGSMYLKCSVVKKLK
ncbi:MAG: alkylphosphonate utilization protein [Bdellovibrionaceae bacterium]|nr:alkylphosphonate utilization protein [Pseudobdellovibrionaceae bacterium]|tara:strand:- start:86281 stop:86646 length:366 start_codon:yes stop_codon:yes gene_type:complete